MVQQRMSITHRSSVDAVLVIPQQPTLQQSSLTNGMSTICLHTQQAISTIFWTSIHYRKLITVFHQYDKSKLQVTEHYSSVCYNIGSQHRNLHKNSWLKNYFYFYTIRWAHENKFPEYKNWISVISKSKRIHGEL